MAEFPRIDSGSSCLNNARRIPGLCRCYLPLSDRRPRFLGEMPGRGAGGFTFNSFLPMEITGTADAILQSKGRSLFTISPTITVFEAIQQMADKNIGALLVMDGPRLLGVFSERDYTRKIALQGRNSRATPVSEVLSAELIAVSPQHSVQDCMRRMTEHRVRHLPVLEGDRVVGILSIGDLVNWIITAQSAAISHLESYIVGSYPG